MHVSAKVEKLQKGETIVTSERGSSMVPLIYSGQAHRLAPVKLEDVRKGDIVFCKIKGKYFTHLVKAVDSIRGLQIGNNRGLINGWTKNVYGKVVEVLPR